MNNRANDNYEERWRKAAKILAPHVVKIIMEKRKMSSESGQPSFQGDKDLTNESEWERVDSRKAQQS
jgi:hypothetical protein